ncbi:hypothetical protein CDL12_17050 [Handroanthus impetiginosus]|uniref:Uncharacterized protein n=1 Tax=Handroanthus impetiginosus TaxID=429701 RepID=A0A2G9GZD4_9LAMI|nr:hypothetical protein CDL12_17050 [Handroanthus impetiginosus]
MEDDKEGDIRVPLIFSLFCLCVVTGGIFLVVYVFIPSLSEPWYPIAALVLIASPWIFWLLTYIYTCAKGCCRRNPVASHQISRRQTTRNASSAAMQNLNGSRNQQGGADSSVASSKEPEMPLTYSV